ncbi:hypothetical protein B0T11DRAFT_271242 [Plectosphaerella cucumerina]|uniref:Zn(2)-C6 fungal-type domain-containing protein n=1 Tax=Plectosphaerella cucumerina TaxID=40658 RepID=A0A8K0X8H6_9PEZI|nr:hypothetical protein B0T11DRAFT_271242 [Plectosphaerella cucumerina]
MNRRPRACEACQKLKIKCDPSPSGPCSRCERAGFECVLAAPRLQRDRIAELEAQLNELRVTKETPPADESLTAFLDARISPGTQRRVLADFASRALVAWPVLSPADILDLDGLRTTAPHLLFAIMAFPGETGLQLQTQEELVVRAMSEFGNEIIARGNRSLQMVKALLMAAFWFRQARHSPHGHCYQLVQLAVDMAIDIGIAGPQLARSPPAYFSATKDPTSLDARRTWVACYLATTAQALGTRRPPTLAWTPYLEECVRLLDGGDGLLSQIARVTRICGDIAEQLDLCNLTVYRAVDDAASQMAMLRGRVAAWYAQLPRDLTSHPQLAFWREIALVLIHEIVLHTPTNKVSFAAPYVPEKITMTDFATPVDVSPEVDRTLRRLVDACHSAVQRFADMGTSMMLAGASLTAAPAVLHAHFLLTQAHVAVTGQGNTLGGRILGPSDVALAVSMGKLEDVSRALDLVDPYQASYTTIMLQSSRWMRTWLKDYDAIVTRYRESLAKLQGVSA